MLNNTSENAITMLYLKDVIVENRKELRPLGQAHFANKEHFSNWKRCVKALHMAVLEYQHANLRDDSAETVEEKRGKVYQEWTCVLSCFEHKVLAERIGKHHTDINYLVGIAGTVRVHEKYTTDESGNLNLQKSKEYLPVSDFAFRKGVECFISDRITGSNGVLTTDDIERERANRKKYKEQQAQKAAESQTTAQSKPAAQKSKKATKAA